MPTQSNDTRRDTLGRTFHTPNNELRDSTLQGDRAPIRSGIMRRDERKGSELLNQRDFGKNRGSAQAPLDGSRMRHGDGLRATERIFPLNDVNPTVRTDLLAIFRNPAAVRAFVTNPDKTIKTISATMPHLKETLEKHAPFTKKGDVFEVNTESRMFTTIQREIATGIPSAELGRISALKDSLDHLLAAPCGSTAGSEMASYRLLRSFAEQGPLTVKTHRAAEHLESAMDTKRAKADLEIVRVLSTLNRHVEPSVSTQPVHVMQQSTSVGQTEAYRPTGMLDIQPPSIKDRVSGDVFVGAPQPSAAPQIPGVYNPTGILEVRPPSIKDRISEDVFKGAPQPPSVKEAIPAPTIPPVIVPEVIPQPQQKPAPQAPQASVELSPTMQRLVDVVNHSSLDRQIGSPRNKPILELSDRDDEKLKAMLTDPLTKRELLGYSDEQLKAGFEAVRPDRIKYLEEWLAVNHRNAVKHPRMAESMAGITPADTNRIGQVVGIASTVARERAQNSPQ